MGTYIDTCTIISFILQDGNFNKSSHIFNNDLKNEDLYISAFSILEIYATLSRNINKFKLIPGLEKSNISNSDKIKIALRYTLRILNLIIIDDNDEMKILGKTNVKSNKIFYESLKLAPKIELPSGDLIHATYANRLSSEGKINQIASLDNHFKKKESLLKTHTGLDLIHC